MRDAKARNEMRDAKCEILDASPEKQETRCDIRDARCEKQETSYRYRNYGRRLVDTFVNKTTPSIYTGMRA